MFLYHIYRTREEIFHWDLNRCAELNSSSIVQKDQIEEDVERDQMACDLVDQETFNDLSATRRLFSYAVNSFFSHKSGNGSAD